MSKCAKCGCQVESPFDGKTVIHDVKRCAGIVPQRLIRRIDDRSAYESDVAEAQKAYDANPSCMNHEDLYAAKRALRRHWPNAQAQPRAGRK